MNLKKLLIIAFVSLFAVGIMLGSVEASHTFKRGGYKATFSNKEYNKVKNDPENMYYSVKQVKKGTKKYWYKTDKLNTYREYYDKNGKYKGWKYFIHTHHLYENKYCDAVVKEWQKTVKHKNSDGSYYVDYIDYEKYRFKKYKTPNKFIVLGKFGGKKIRAKLMTTYHDYGINM